VQSLRRFLARNNAAGCRGIGRRAGVCDQRRCRPLAQEDVYRVVGRQPGPWGRGLLEHGVPGGTIIGVGDAAEAQPHPLQPLDDRSHGHASQAGHHAGSPADRQLNRGPHEQWPSWERILRQDHAKRDCGILTVPRHIDDEMQGDNHLRGLINGPTKQQGHRRMQFQPGATPFRGDNRHRDNARRDKSPEAQSARPRPGVTALAGSGHARSRARPVRDRADKMPEVRTIFAHLALI